MKRFDMDAALDALGREVQTGSPRPGPDLVARVLADAAAVAPAPEVQLHPGEVRSAASESWLDRMFGWTGGVVATMALCFAIGIGVGLGMEDGDMPMAGAAQEELMFAESDFLQDEIL
ncbi:MAG: hypothetical protein AAFV19_10450 [Pseudomonadota bacterium]